jgi:2',3'-cyclic-nucleotide 2'-phosphodiesterase
MKAVTILFLGDIYGRPGREAVVEWLPELKREHNPDLIVANGENIAHGSGMNMKSYDQMREAGIDFFTSGNHIFDKPEVADRLDDPGLLVLRPANYPGSVKGRGVQIVAKAGITVKIVSLQGHVFMPDATVTENPFVTLDRIVADDDADVTFVDLHAEATSEKVSLAYDFDGRVSAVLGTHTHVQTADARILPGGTGFQSDVGMCGPVHSSLGVDVGEVIKSLRTGSKFKKLVAPGPVRCCATLLEINPTNGKTLSINPLSKQFGGRV